MGVDVVDHLRDPPGVKDRKLHRARGALRVGHHDVRGIRGHANATDLGQDLRQHLGALARTPAELIEISATTKRLLVDGNALLAPEAAIAAAHDKVRADAEAAAGMVPRPSHHPPNRAPENVMGSYASRKLKSASGPE
jgi:hypothetical protein